MNSECLDMFSKNLQKNPTKKSHQNTRFIDFIFQTKQTQFELNKIKTSSENKKNRVRKKIALKN